MADSACRVTWRTTAKLLPPRLYLHLQCSQYLNSMNSITWTLGLCNHLMVHSHLMFKSVLNERKSRWHPRWHLMLLNGW
jgi:hypothetical protein